jgi:hypothetical protein
VVCAGGRLRFVYILFGLGIEIQLYMAMKTVISSKTVIECRCASCACSWLYTTTFYLTNLQRTLISKGNVWVDFSTVAPESLQLVVQYR